MAQGRKAKSPPSSRRVSGGINKETTKKQKSLLLAELKGVGSMSEAVAFLRKKREELLLEKARIRQELSLLEDGDDATETPESVEAGFSMEESLEDANDVVSSFFQYDDQDESLSQAQAAVPSASTSENVEMLLTSDLYPLSASSSSSAEEVENSQNTANETGVGSSSASGEGELKGKWVQCSHALLKREKRPLSVTDIIQIALEEGMILTKSKTPKNTLTSILNTEVKRKGSVFRKVAPSVFTLKEFLTGKEVLVASPPAESF